MNALAVIAEPALAEVKSWRDKLNENQKRWIEDNHRYLHLPFKLVQVAQGGV
jgi:hypothetical protein